MILMITGKEKDHSEKQPINCDKIIEFLPDHFVVEFKDEEAHHRIKITDIIWPIIMILMITFGFMQKSFIDAVLVYILCGSAIVILNIMSIFLSIIFKRTEIDPKQKEIRITKIIDFHKKEFHSSIHFNQIKKVLILIDTKVSFINIIVHTRKRLKYLLYMGQDMNIFPDIEEYMRKILDNNGKIIAVQK